MFVDYAKKIECDKLKTYIQISNNNVAVLRKRSIGGTLVDLPIFLDN